VTAALLAAPAALAADYAAPVPEYRPPVQPLSIVSERAVSLRNPGAVAFSPT
jgi:lipid A 3-O-deacylase